MKKINAGIVVYALFFLMTILAAHAEEIRVVPIGRAAGIQIYTDGLLVIGTSDISGHDAAKDAGIKTGDRIIAVNGSEAGTAEEFARLVNENPEGLNLDIARDNQQMSVNAVPVLSEDNVYRLGLWVRDSCAGVGTITYYNPQSNTFAALGHAVNDVDTGGILPVKSGVLTNCDIVSVAKSRRGAPGEINASFSGDKLGEITVNSSSGLFGNAEPDFFSGNGELMTVAAKSQVHTGDAYILSDIFGTNTEKYSIKIDKITDEDDKGLVIEITDERLKDMAGGIVQGMSGSPIIQDGYLVGAVTHVFVNNPLKGYGTLAEKMIDTERRQA